MKYFCLFLLCCFSLFGISGVYAENIQSDLTGNLLRLHIIANSNSEHDQNIKLLVRDEILKSAGENPTKAELDKIVDKTLKDIGADYAFKSIITRTYVPEKKYKNIHLPAGIYNCINVTLGEGDGENWWCVAYPPLCFTESVFGELSESGKLLLKNKLDGESLRTIIYNGDVNIRFRIVDEFLKLKELLW